MKNKKLELYITFGLPLLITLTIAIFSFLSKHDIVINKIKPVQHTNVNIDNIIFSNRIKTLNRKSTTLFILCFSSILLINFWANERFLKNKYLSKFLDIWLKLSYAIVAAFIFYFINIHWVTEDKKAKTFRFINNRTHELHSEIRRTITSLVDLSKTNIKIPDSKISQNEMQKICKNINPQKGIFFRKTHPNLYHYLDFRKKKIKSIIHEILNLNAPIDSEYLQQLSFIDEILSRKDFEYMYNQDDICFLSGDLIDIFNHSIESRKIMLKNYSVYSQEYHHYARESRRKQE